MTAFGVIASRARCGLVLGLSLAVSGCLATRAELEQVAGQQAELSLELVRLQDHAADLTIRMQAIREDLRGLRGEMVEADQGRRPIASELSAIEGRLAEIEQRTAHRLKLSELLGSDDSGAEAPSAWTDVTEAFADAQEKMRRGDHAAAAKILIALLQRWPQDELATRAQIRLGATFSAEGKHLDAIDQYLTVIADHPQSRWLPEAYLGLGQSLYRMGKVAPGRRVLADLQRLFPESAEATVAGVMLAASSAAPVSAPVAASASVAGAAVGSLTHPVAPKPVSAEALAPVSDPR